MVRLQELVLCRSNGSVHPRRAERMINRSAGTRRPARAGQGRRVQPSVRPAERAPRIAFPRPAPDPSAVARGANSMHSVNDNVRVPAHERLWMPARCGQVDRHSDAAGAAPRNRNARHHAADGPECRAAASTLVADGHDARRGHSAAPMEAASGAPRRSYQPVRA